MPPALRVLRMGLGFEVTAVVAVTARMGLADHLAQGARTAAELAEATGANATTLRRFLRACVSIGLMDLEGEDHFTLTPVGACLRSDIRSMHGFAMGMGEPAHLRPFEHLYEGVMESRAVARDALGMEMWEYYDAHPDAMATLTEHLDEVTAELAPLVVEAYDLSRFRSIVDVGGNQGYFLAALLDAAPQATGVLFDRPEVMDAAGDLIADRHLEDRVRLVGGDFLEGVPEGGDLYVLKGIMHDWDDEHISRILSNCHRAAAPGSTLLSFEGMARSKPPFDPLIHLIDLSMLLLVGGRERTREEFDQLFGGAGWRIERVIPLPSLGYFPYHIIEAKRT
jgi:SAM-dependent methyltransferase